VTVAELITALSAVEPTHLVVVPGREGGFAEVDVVRTLGLRLNCNRHEFFGPHDIPQSGQPAQAMAVALDASSLPW
jgi:hypothetical protein